MEKELKLISGEYSKQEAKEILTDLIRSKIQYHTNNIISQRERFGECEAVEHSDKRVKELQDMYCDIVELLDKAEDEDAIFQIESNVKVDVKVKDSVS